MSRPYIRFFSFALLFALLLTACGSESVPDGILLEEEMVPVLKDLQIAYAGVDQTVKNPRQRPMKYEEMNQIVLKKYKLSQTQFFDSYQWYQTRPELMDTIFQRVINQLNQELVEIQNQRSNRPAGGLPEMK